MEIEKQHNGDCKPQVGRGCAFCNGGAAPEILKLQEKVLDLVSPDAKGYLPVIGGAHIRLSGSATEAFGDLYSCWKVTLNACYA